MWSFERRLRVGAILLLASVSLAACNVRPLYAPDAGAGSGEMTQILASIHVSEPDSRVEQVLRNALMFRLYGIQRDDVDYILDTFPIVKRKDEAAYGEYRTKRLILERYDEMAAAEAAGEEYQTVLDPPPADPSLCHPESTRPDWARPTP